MTDEPMAGRLAVVITGASAALDITSHLLAWRNRIDAPMSILLTHSALNFVNPGALRYLADDVFEPSTPGFNPIGFANRSKLFVVCPATANFVVTASLGLASSPALTAMLATPAPRLLFPHMNPVMWRARTTQRAIVELRESGVIVVSPEPTKVLTLWDRSLHDGEAMPLPARTAEIVVANWRGLRAA